MVAARPVVSLHNLTVSYRQHPALHHISGSFAPGSLTAVVGPNGSGKSTLLKSIVGLLPIEGGRSGGALAVAPSTAPCWARSMPPCTPWDWKGLSAAASAACPAGSCSG